MSRSGRARGQPVVALIGLLLLWVGLRIMVHLERPRFGRLDIVPVIAAQNRDSVTRKTRGFGQQQFPSAPQASETAPRVILSCEPRIPPRSPAGWPGLRVGAKSASPLPADPTATGRGEPDAAPAIMGMAQRDPNPSPALPLRDRVPAPALSGDAWLLWRAAAPGLGRLVPTYGASQIGAILRVAVPPGSPHRTVVYLRGSAALDVTARDVGAGLAVRPLMHLPVDVSAELRVETDGRRQRVRPAIGLVGQAAPRSLPLGLAASAYVQAGWVGGSGASLYGDAQVRADGTVARLAGVPLRAGLAVWAAGQRGAGRLDLGPSLSLALPLGQDLHLRLQADWRLRAAGNAAPGSGPALVIATSF